MGSGRFWEFPQYVLVLIVVGIVIASLSHAGPVRRSHHGGRLEPKGCAPRRRQRQALPVLGLCHFGRNAALAGIFYAARQNSAGTDTGVGWEINALAAGCSAASAWRRARNHRARADGSGDHLHAHQRPRATRHRRQSDDRDHRSILLVAVGFNVKCVKNKGKVLQKIYVVQAGSTSSRQPRSSATAERFSRKTIGSRTPRRSR